MDANWAGVLVDGLAAAATLAAVVSAFVLQAKQREADRHLQERLIFTQQGCAIDAVRRAVQVLGEAASWARKRDKGSDAFVEWSKLDWTLRAVDYYLTRDILDTALVNHLITVRGLLVQAVDQYDYVRKQATIDGQRRLLTTIAPSIESHAHVRAGIIEDIDRVAARIQEARAKHGRPSHAASHAAKAASEGR